MNGETKPGERELKLTLPGRAAEKEVIEKLREAGYTAEKPVNLLNEDLYLDSYDWWLMKKKAALRYRLVNGKPFYTLKSVGQFDRGIAQRTELEIALPNRLENPQDLPEKRMREEVLPLIFPRRLLEIARVRTRRREYPIISPLGAKISLAFDSSSFRRERPPALTRRKCLYELEGELKEGDIAALVSLRELLARTFHFEFSSQSKLERAISTLNLSPLTREADPELVVKLTDPLEIAVQKILSAEFRWFQQQLDGVIGDLDPEFVHQARVTTRRMRSAVRVFQSAMAQSTAASLADELKWLGRLFGAVRDIDVYLLNLTSFALRLGHFPGGARRAIEEGIREVRGGPFGALVEALRSKRYEKFATQMAKYSGSPPPKITRPAGAAETVAQFAPEVIKADFQAVNERGRAVLATPEMKTFHLLRIEMKKLRYATEFVAPAYGGALEPFIKRTVEIQDTLGELQDTVFTQAFSRQLLKEWKGRLVGAEVPFALGEIFQLQAEIARERRSSFAGIWERFSAPETAQALARAFARAKSTPQS
jgi:triphosphatase